MWAQYKNSKRELILRGNYIFPLSKKVYKITRKSLLTTIIQAVLRIKHNSHVENSIKLVIIRYINEFVY